MILEKACWCMNSTAKQIHPSLQCSFKLSRVTHSICLFCVGAQVVTYYNTAKATVFDDLGWWLYPSHSVCFPFTEPGLCVNTGLFLFSSHTEWKASERRGYILWISQKVFWIIIVENIFNVSVLHVVFIMITVENLHHRSQPRVTLANCPKAKDLKVAMMWKEWIFI